MNQTVVGPKTQDVMQFRTHGLIGWYGPSIQADESDRLDSMTTAMRSNLALFRKDSDQFQCATTGSFAPLPNGFSGYVNLVGAPWFNDPELVSLASREGAASALATCYSQNPGDFYSHIWGSFCFSIIDLDNDRVVIGIDRLGQHTLYYLVADNVLAWGSTANAALASMQAPPEILKQGIYNYIYFHMVPSQGTIFHGLQKLPAAHVLKFEKKQLSVSKYWLPQFSESQKPSIQEEKAKLISILRKAVARAKGNETAVGSFLSGGLDSSTVTGLLAEINDSQTRAFSIGFSAEGYDEMPYARITAQHFGVELNEYYVTPDDVVTALPLVARSYDEPFGNSSALPAYFCARFAADNGIKLLLAGDGGDELFAGNERYGRQFIFERYLNVPSHLRRGLIEPLVNLLPKLGGSAGKLQSYIAQAKTPLPDRLQTYNFLSQYASEEVFADDFLAEVSPEYPIELLREIYSGPQECSVLNRMLYLDWQLTLADNDLRKVSHMCALAGIDVAYPMLDDDLIDFSCQIPSKLKIKGGNLRHFYRESMKGWLPDKTLSKNKKGFGLPFGIWMRSHRPLQEMAYDNLLSLKGRRYFKPQFIDNAIEMHRSGHAAYFGELVWILTVFELWMQSRDNSSYKPQVQ